MRVDRFMTGRLIWGKKRKEEEEKVAERSRMLDRSFAVTPTV